MMGDMARSSVLVISRGQCRELRSLAAHWRWMIATPGPTDAIEALIRRVARCRVRVVVLELAGAGDLTLIRGLRRLWRPNWCVAIGRPDRPALERAVLAAGATCYLNDCEQAPAVVAGLLDLNKAGAAVEQATESVAAARPRPRAPAPDYSQRMDASRRRKGTKLAKANN